jgi:hypothetical protein
VSRKSRAKVTCPNPACGKPLKPEWAACPWCTRARAGAWDRPPGAAKASFTPAPSFIAKSARAVARKAARILQECPNGCGAGTPGTHCQRCFTRLPGEAPSAANGFTGKAARLPCPRGHGKGEPGDRNCVKCGERLTGAPPPPRTAVKSASGEDPRMADYRASHDPDYREAVWQEIHGQVSSGKVAGRG